MTPKRPAPPMAQPPSKKVKRTSLPHHPPHPIQSTASYNTAAASVDKSFALLTNPNIIKDVRLEYNKPNLSLTTWQFGIDRDGHKTQTKN